MSCGCTRLHGMSRRTSDIQSEGSGEPATPTRRSAALQHAGVADNMRGGLGVRISGSRTPRTEASVSASVARDTTYYGEVLTDEPCSICGSTRSRRIYLYDGVSVACIANANGRDRCREREVARAMREAAATLVARSAA